MNRSTRGAARISAVWMIVVIVAFFVALAVAFIGFDEAGTLEQERDALGAQLVTSEGRYDAERVHVRAMSEAVGYYDEEAGSARSELDAMKEGLTSLRDAFPDMDPSVKTFQDAVPVVIGGFNARGSRVRDLESQIGQLRTEIQSKDKALRDLTAGKDRELADLRSSLQDAETAAADAQSNLEKQIASIRAELNDRDGKYRSIQTDMDEQSRSYDRERETTRTRMADMSSKLQFLREPEASDGQLLAVSKDLSLGWINRGAHDRLARGTRFRVVSGSPIDNYKVKAWAEVTRVEADMAEVRIYDRTDPFDPPVRGDVVYNPLYDPDSARNAVLVGRFSGSFNELELKALLSQIGIHVQGQLDLTTDYLIVGQELYLDPETQEPLEEPMPPSELPAYKDAVANGLAIVPIKDIRQYFKN